MSVYVASDDIREDSGMIFFRMVADTDEELKAMASNLGIRADWQQQTSNNVHYNYYEIDYNKKRLAIVLGAHVLSTRELDLLKITGGSIYGDGNTKNDED